MADSIDVFISWSGPRSKALAIQLHDWLRAVIQRANPWMSERDIEAGQRWNDQISERLKNTHFGIICLTPENLDAPWLLFEAGALAKALDVARVIPVLLGVRKADIRFPLAQFQAVEADRDGFFSLVSALNRSLGEQQLPAGLLVNIFAGLWSTLEEALSALPSSSTPEQGLHRSDREVLEDVLEGVRSLQHRLTGTTPENNATLESADWEDYYIRGVNLANSRGGEDTNIGALRAYGEAIALAPRELPDNARSRLYAYRGAILKRLGRLDEAQHDLLLARNWAHEPREIEDALYNLACVAALAGRRDEALALMRELISLDTKWAGLIASKEEYFGNLQHDQEFQALILTNRSGRLVDHEERP